MKRILTTIAVASLVLAACGGDDDGGADASTATGEPTNGSSAGSSAGSTGGAAAGVTIEGVWARTSAAGQTTGAVYFDITSDIDDTLVSASVPVDVAAAAEIHEVVPAADASGDMSAGGTGDMSGDTGGMSSGDDAGEMSGGHEMSTDMSGDMGAMVMQELTDGLSLPAGETVSLAPGGYHVMLLDLAEPLEVGDEFELTLEFEHAASETITVPVAETAP